MMTPHKEISAAKSYRVLASFQHVASQVHVGAQVAWLKAMKGLKTRVDLAKVLQEVPTLPPPAEVPEDGALTKNNVWAMQHANISRGSAFQNDLSKTKQKTHGL